MGAARGGRRARSRRRVGHLRRRGWRACHVQLLYFRVFLFLTENLSSDSGVSSPSALNSPGVGIEGLNRRRKKRTSIETNIRVALEKSFLEVSEVFASPVLGSGVRSS